MSERPARLRVCEAAFYLRNVQTRMPFRYGVAQLTGYPILHVRVFVELADGTRSEGVAADALPPKWFDKSPRNDYQDNINDLLLVTFAARDAYLGLNDAPATPFELFRDGYDAVMDYADAEELNHLTASFGSAIFERAVLDAVGNALGTPYHSLIRENIAGVQMAAVHPELGKTEPADVVRAVPLDAIWVRHTVGLADPILTVDIAPSERLDDGLPQSLEEYVAAHKLRYFKVKVSGDFDADTLRLSAIAPLLDAQIPEPYYISLDGNEQFKDLDSFLALIEALRSRPVFQRFYESIVFIEQPLERRIALDEDLARGVAALSDEKPVIIDESDGDLDTFKRAIRIGYRGISAKNCKGVYKSLMNLALAQLYTAHSTDGRTYFLTGEDLANAPIVPLHQDLATLATLGIPHAERNGHHYLRGLAHLSDAERNACLTVHPELYTIRNDVAQLNVQNGQIRIGSLQAAGYGLGVPIDYESMTPVSEWLFESLGISAS